jgi:hypothetical protein
MTALFIAWVALFVAVIGCAVLDQRPTRMTQGAHDVLGKGMSTVSFVRLPSRECGPTTIDGFYDGWRTQEIWRGPSRIASTR